MLEILHQVLLNVLGERSVGIWRLALGGGVLYTGARGAGEDRESMGIRVGGSGVGCFLCNLPGHTGASPRLPTVGVKWDSPSKVRLVTVPTISPAWDWIFLFSESA